MIGITLIIIALHILALIAPSCDNQQLNSLKSNVIVLLIDDAGYADFGFAGCMVGEKFP